MSIVIITTSTALSDRITKRLNDEVLDVKKGAILDRTFETKWEHNKPEVVIAVINEQGIISIGEDVIRIKSVLGNNTRFIVCIPSLVDRAALFECGADEIIVPEDWTENKISDRILAQLILEHTIHPSRFGQLVGGSFKMRTIYEEIKKVAHLREPVLIFGETGTGKELIASEIHLQSRSSTPYVPINCPEINPELFSSELFGHERGAFTGAEKSRVGLIASAGSGTVFLDEIGDLDLPTQAKLLRVLEYGEIRRVGSNQIDRVKARFILATNLDLKKACAEGRFRNDLYERISGFTLKISPLRERKVDIGLLATSFVEKYNEEYEAKLKITAEHINYLMRYDWPGNVRELRSAIRKAAAFADNSRHLSLLILQEKIKDKKAENETSTIRFDPSVDSWRDVINRAQICYFRAVLKETNGDREVARKLSGLGRSQFFEKIKDIAGQKF